jgi:hypothetical protein
LVVNGPRWSGDGGAHVDPGPELRGTAFVLLVFEAAGHPPKIAVASRSMIRIAGLFSPFLRELNEKLYEFERPFVSNASKFEAAFGPVEPTPHPEAMRRTVDWFRRRNAP